MSTEMRNLLNSAMGVDIWARDLQSGYLLMESEPAVQAGWTSGTDVSPLVAAVTALVRMHMQRNVAAYRDQVTRSGAWGV